MKNVIIVICGFGEEERKALTEALGERGSTVLSACNADECRLLTRRESADIQMFDSRLLHGPEAERFRRWLSNGGIAGVVVGDNDRMEELESLRLGADDYISRPLLPELAWLRVENLLSRMGVRRKEKTIEVAQLSLRRETFRAYLNGEPLELVPGDFKLLCCLAENPGKVMTREQLQNAVWGYEYCGSPRAVDTQIKRLRSAFKTGDPGFAIQSVYGVGYKLELLPD